jgi:glycosyltransferase involved in cell wall biosynthesis
VTEPVPTKTRVLVDGSPLTDGRRDAGIGRYVRHLCDAMAGIEDLDVHLARPPWSPPTESWAVRFVSAQPGLLAAALRHRPAVVHATAADPLAGWPLHRQVVTVHDVIPWTREAPPGITRRYLAVQRQRIRGCARVIAVSSSVASDVASVLGVEPARLRVVAEGFGAVFTRQPGGLDDVVRRDLDIPPGDFVMWVGSLRAHDPRKALDVLLGAMTSIASEASLVLVGAKGEESRRLAGEASRRGVRLSMPGFVADDVLAALYRQAAVVALPSLHEGFGLPVLEALASGVAVVSTRAGNIPDLAGDAAVLVEPGDTGALGDALKLLLRDGPRRAELAARGPAVAAAYSWERAAQLTAAVYREVAARAPR